MGVGNGIPQERAAYMNLLMNAKILRHVTIVTKTEILFNRKTYFFLFSHEGIRRNTKFRIVFYIVF